MSVTAWTQHFKNMSLRNNLLDEMYLLNQKGRGFGYNNNHLVYRLNQKGSGNISTNQISPVVQAVNQAKSQLEDDGVKVSNMKKIIYFNFRY